MLVPLLFAALMTASKPAPADLRPLDQKSLHAAYNEGNFDSVIRDIEGFQKTHKTYSESDSIFIAKHLAVVYSANPATREKGKYYMFRLLEMLPSAKLIDMYVSDEIDRIFDKVREEFIVRQKDFGVDSSRVATPNRAPVNQAKADSSKARPSLAQPAPAQAAAPAVTAKTRPEPENHHKTAWIVAGVGAVTIGLATVYFLASSDANGKDQTYDVP